jgi:type II secretory pathway component PulF
MNLKPAVQTYICLEPLMILFMGGMVAFIVFSIINAYYANE